MFGQIKNAIGQVVQELRGLTTAVNGLRSSETAITRQDLKEMEQRIMSTIKEFSASVNAAFADIGASVDDLVKSLAGVTADVTTLKDTIDKLQNSAGSVTPEDQALLDSITNQASAVSSSLKTAAVSLKELDNATAPSEVPTPPTT